MLEESRLSPAGYSLVRGTVLCSLQGNRGLCFLGDGRMGGGAHETETTGGLLGFLEGVAVAGVLVDHVDERLSNRGEIEGVAKGGACGRLGRTGKFGCGFGGHEDVC